MTPTLHEIALALNYEFDNYRWHFNFLIKQPIEFLRTIFPYQRSRGR